VPVCRIRVDDSNSGVEWSGVEWSIKTENLIYIDLYFKVLIENSFHIYSVAIFAVPKLLAVQTIR